MPGLPSFHFEFARNLDQSDCPRLLLAESKMTIGQCARLNQKKAAGGIILHSLCKGLESIDSWKSSIISVETIVLP